MTAAAATTDATQPALRGLVLDFDGTIAETERHGHRVAYNRAFADFGLDWHWDEALYGELLAIAGGRERMRHYLASRRQPALDAVAGERLIADLHRAKERHFAALAPAVPFRPGVRRLLREAHAAGLRIAIATTALQSGVAAVLAQDPAVAALVEVIAGSETVERKKPAPDVYAWVLRRLGLPAAACVAIEDSSIGLRAARAAGVPTIVTVSDYTAAEDFAGAAAVLGDLGEPDRPAASLAGLSPAAGYVDVAFLREVVAGARTAPR